MNPHIFSRNPRQNRLVSWVVGSVTFFGWKVIMANMGDQLVKSTRKVKWKLYSSLMAMIGTRKTRIWIWHDVWKPVNPVVFWVKQIKVLYNGPWFPPFHWTPSGKRYLHIREYKANKETCRKLTIVYKRPEAWKPRCNRREDETSTEVWARFRRWGLIHRQSRVLWRHEKKRRGQIGLCFYWEEDGLDVTDLGGVAEASVPSGGFLRARLRLSKVTPLPSFVTPTTGGSPFLTNSQRPGRCVY